MRIDKVIVKSALSTLAAIGVLYVLLVSVLCVVFPQVMMNLTYDVGFDRLSMHFASVAYERTGETHYVAFATETAIGSDNVGKTEKFGLLLLEDEKFVVYAEERVATMEDRDADDYRRYIQSQVCLAKYDQGKVDEAVDFAFNAIGPTFPENNPVQSICYNALLKKDKETVKGIYDRLLLLSVPQDDVAEWNNLIKLIEAENLL